VAHLLGGCVLLRVFVVIWGQIATFLGGGVIGTQFPFILSNKTAVE
jgi:hypothetical protein